MAFLSARVLPLTIVALTACATPAPQSGETAAGPAVAASPRAGTRESASDESVRTDLDDPKVSA